MIIFQNKNMYLSALPIPEQVKFVTFYIQTQSVTTSRGNCQTRYEKTTFARILILR